MFSLVLHQTMRPVVIGTAIGIAVASALSRGLSSVLFGVSAADPIGRCSCSPSHWRQAQS